MIAGYYKLRRKYCLEEIIKILMRIQLEKKINKQVRDVSRAFGVDQRQIVKRALLLYLEATQKSLDLRSEFNAWDALSDEALQLTG